MQGLKILMVTDIYYPHPGGIPEHVHNLSRALIRKGHRVHILTGRTKGSVRWEDPPHVIRVGRAVKFPANKSISSVTVSWRIAKKVRKVIEEGRYHVVHTHGPIAPVLPMLAVRYSPGLTVSTFHAAHGDSVGYWLFRKYLNRYFKKIDVRIAVSRVAEESVAKYFPGEYVIVPNGIDVERFRPDLEPLAHLRDSGPVVLFVGRMEPRKGVKYLVLAWERVLREVPEARLVLVGDGPYRAYYRSLVPPRAQDRVVWVGAVDPEELPRYYASADVCCFPATGGESFGIVLLEAMATGKPVVASDISGYRQVMEEGREGLFARPEDPEDLARALVTLLRSPRLREEMGRAGREKALGYSWDRVAARVEELYYQGLRRKGLWPGPPSSG